MSTTTRTLPGSPQLSSNRQTRTALFAGFGGLLVLLCILGLSAISFLGQIKVQEEKIRRDYVERDRVLESLRSDIYLSGTHIRDFLLDTNDVFAAAHREQFLETQRKLHYDLAEYSRLNSGLDPTPVEQLSHEVTAYLQALAPVLAWNVADRHKRAYAFMQDELLPRRMSALSLADRVQQVSDTQLEQNSAAVSVLLSSFRAKLLALLLLTMAIGLAVAAAALWRLLYLENESRRRFTEAVGAREELKRLSTELVSAQESERRRISRELHDEVGQVLSAIMLALGSLRSAIRDNNSVESLRHLHLVEEMTERNARVVRNISLLLRPTMLDDLGLVPALNWLAREVSRTNSLDVQVNTDSFRDDIPDEHRTCVFRVSQEALRNAVRHSGARNVWISVAEKDGLLQLSVEDDGRGFDPAAEGGLGLLGMQERVRSLSGKMFVNSQPGRGTSVKFELPITHLQRSPAERSMEAHPDRVPTQEINPFRTA